MERTGLGNSQIDVIGNTFNLGTIHYVNDSGTNGDTLAACLATTPTTAYIPPAPSSLSKQCWSDQANPLHAGDVILVDSGVYPVAIDLSAIPAGVLILGSPTSPV